MYGERERDVGRKRGGGCREKEGGGGVGRKRGV